MTNGPMPVATRRAGTTLSPDASGVSDELLLTRFLDPTNERAEADFEAIVGRHGPMVLGGCRNVLNDPNDVDDAFQLTFLVLVRKAETIRKRESIGDWLYGVAYRTAL